MADRSSSGSGNGDLEGEPWWAALSRELVHPMQMKLLQAMWESDGPISPNELARIVKGVGAANIDRHMQRLRDVKAVDYAEESRGLDPLDVPYRLLLPHRKIAVAGSVFVQLGRNLKCERRQAGLTQKELAKRASLHRTAIGKLERGESNPAISTVFKVAKGLNIPATNLLKGIE